MNASSSSSASASASRNGYGIGFLFAPPPFPSHRNMNGIRNLSSPLLLRSPRFSFLSQLHHSFFAARGLPQRHSSTLPLTNKITSSALDDHHLLPTSAYVHLPFCKRRCFYCDFAIVAVGERKEESASLIDSTMEGYVENVCSEIVSTFKRWPSGRIRPLRTLFFGGGTPSLLPAKQLERIIKTLEHCCGLEEDMEVSMEMDPGTFTATTLSQFLDCGVNRISLGVQSFHEDLLKACGRSHGLLDVYDAIHVIQESGIRNWSLDLISSLPHQTISVWEETLQEAIAAHPAHVSVYDLQIEEGTKFGSWYKVGQHPLPDDESSAAFYRTASAILRGAGYEHYEISNYAKPGYQCHHNLVYWKNMPYYAFGLGSTSYVQGHRFSRPRKWKAYVDYVKNLDSASSHPSSLAQERLGGHAVNTMKDDAQELLGGHAVDTIKDDAQELLGGDAVDTMKDDAQELLGGHTVDTMQDDAQELLGGDAVDTMQDDDRLFDTIMLSLRLASGLDLTLISRTFGSHIVACICEAFLPFVLSGHAIVLDVDHLPISPDRFSALVSQQPTLQLSRDAISCIRLSDPEGFLLSNEIISTLFSSLSKEKCKH